MCGRDYSRPQAFSNNSVTLESRHTLVNQWTYRDLKGLFSYICFFFPQISQIVIDGIKLVKQQHLFNANLYVSVANRNINLKYIE